ncbi:hypothetical protein VTI74DRAFT_6362 [Chaetomium olivicolor]
MNSLFSSWHCYAPFCQGVLVNSTRLTVRHGREKHQGIHRSYHHDVAPSSLGRSLASRKRLYGQSDDIVPYQLPGDSRRKDRPAVLLHVLAIDNFVELPHRLPSLQLSQMTSIDIGSRQLFRTPKEEDIATGRVAAVPLNLVATDDSGSTSLVSTLVVSRSASRELRSFSCSKHHGLGLFQPVPHPLAPGKSFSLQLNPRTF